MRLERPHRESQPHNRDALERPGRDRDRHDLRRLDERLATAGCVDGCAVGDVVTWSLSEATDSVTGWLEAALGRDRARSVTHDEDHHTDDPETSVSTRGRVTSIERASCRFAPSPGDPRTLTPVAGTALLEQVSRADGWEPEVDGRRSNGYLVTLDVDPAAGS